MVECSNKTCEIITETVCPLLGIITAYFIFLSPLKEIQALRKKTGECTMNPIPSIMVFCNCLSQTLYSFTIHNHWNYWPNFGGVILGLYYVAIIYSAKLKPRVWNMSTTVLLGFTLLCLIGGALAFILFDDNYEAAKNSMGIIGIVILCGIYGSPLTTMYEVIHTRNSSSINFIMTVALLINGVFWTAYGVFINDFFIWFPNAVGTFSAVIQFLLFLIFPRKSTTGTDVNEAQSYSTVNKDNYETETDVSGITLQPSELSEKDISNIV
jgi:solute carrier family 50 protein (sugar transporter)